MTGGGEATLNDGERYLDVFSGKARLAGQPV